MAKNRKEIEDEILIEERLGDEEDYEEYARRRDAKEGQHIRQSRIMEEEEIRQNREYERRKRQREEETLKAQRERQLKAYNKRKRRPHPIRNFFLILLILIIAAAAGCIAYMRSLLQTVNSISLEESVQNSICQQVRDDAAMAGYQNIALFGVDSREQDLLSGNNRSDTIMICSIGKKSGEIKLISVYRDTLLDIGGGEFRKCNAAYAFGGPQQAIEMLNRNLDLNITDFVTVGFDGLADTIDAFGGIDLEITEEEMEWINDYAYYMFDGPDEEFEALTDYGMQHLSGLQATAYCRIRYTEGDDFKRAERQRTVLNLTMQKAKEANPLELISAANSVLGEVATSLDTVELLTFILRARSMDLTETGGFPNAEDRAFATVNGESCVAPYYLTTNVKTLHRVLFGEEEYEPSSTVKENSEIINSYVY